MGKLLALQRRDRDGSFDGNSARETAPRARYRHRLTVKACDAAAVPAGQRITKLVDGAGLYLLVLPTGRKGWRLDYRWSGRRRCISLGVYPAVSLADARRAADEARRILQDNEDPSHVRRRAKQQRQTSAAQVFRDVALEWLELRRQWFAPATAKRVTLLLHAHLFPRLGHLPVATITATDLLEVLREISSCGRHDTAHRCRQMTGQILRYAISTGRTARDISADLKGALAPVVVTHRATLTRHEDIGALLRAIDGYHGSDLVRLSLQLLALTFVRPGELRRAKWADVDLETAVWKIPAADMKGRQAHRVPLAPQAVALWRRVALLTGDGTYCFPSLRTAARPMSDNTMMAALRRLGYAKHEMSAHGFRAMARTVLDEDLRFRPEIIELQLAHRVPGVLGDTYNRSHYFEERTAMMVAYANFLDAARGLPAVSRGAR